MNRLAERVARDLHVIADRATPSSSAWDSILSRIEAQTDDVDMEVIWREPNSQKAPSRRVTLGLGVAASAILIIVGVLALTGGHDDTDGVVPASEAQQAIELAQRFVEARDGWDGEAVRALVADDAVIIDDSFTDVTTADQYLINADFERATELRFLQPECIATTLDLAIRVTCAYTMENAWSVALGVGPFTGSSFQFLIADGQIQQIRHIFNISEFDPQVYTVWLEWLADTHPDADAVLYSDTGIQSTPEALALFDQYTNEFAAVQLGIDFIEARDGWDGEAVRALVADDAVIIDDSFTDVTTADQYLINADFERATELRFLQPECIATTLDLAIRVTCAYTMENAWSVALGVGPFTGSSFQFLIADGQIQQIRHIFNISEFDPQVYTVWLEWLADTHPDADAVLYSDTGIQSTPEALALFDQYTNEFVSSLSDSGPN